MEQRKSTAESNEGRRIMKYLEINGVYFKLQTNTPDNLEEIMKQPATETIAEQVTREDIPDRAPDQTTA